MVQVFCTTHFEDQRKKEKKKKTPNLKAPQPVKVFFLLYSFFFLFNLLALFCVSLLFLLLIDQFNQ